MFDLEQSLKKYLSEFKNNSPINEEMKTEIKSRLIRVGILNKNGKLKKLPIE